MTIGKLLKQYRIEKGLTQKQFAGNTISTSYYSKVEKNEHRITAEDLILLLRSNGISLWSFFKKISTESDFEHERHISLNERVMNAYYHNKKKELRSIISEVENSNLTDKTYEILLIKGWIECMKGADEKSDIELREELKDRVFNLPELNLNKLSLFCNFMEFYDLESNIYITRQAINKYSGSTNIEIQEVLLGIVNNLLYLSIKENNYNYVDYLLRFTKTVHINPRLFFLKENIALYENIIKYHYDHKSLYEENCRAIIQSINLTGMKEYSNELIRVVDKYLK